MVSGINVLVLVLNFNELRNINNPQNGDVVYVINDNRCYIYTNNFWYKLVNTSKLDDYFLKIRRNKIDKIISRMNGH